MKLRYALALVLAGAIGPAGCGGKDKAGPTGARDKPAPVQRVVVLEWDLTETPGSDAAPPRTSISLSLTDQNGATQVEPIGEATGACTPWTSAQLAAHKGTVIGLGCAHEGATTAFRAVRAGAELVILRGALEPGAAEEDIAYEEHARIPIPGDASVRAGS